MYTIYQVLNKLNGESYVGFTTENPPENRWTNHQRRAKNGSLTHFHCAIRKYTPPTFNWNILEEGQDAKIGLKVREPYWISLLKPEYNKTAGGEGKK